VVVKLRILSDLHFEFHPDGGDAFLSNLPDVECDATVIAGDLCDLATMRDSMRLVSMRCDRVLYVLGNHECYGGTIALALETAAKVCADLRNVTLLNDSAVDVAGVRVHGCTLWFPYPQPEIARFEQGMTDFHVIRGLRDSVGERNAASCRYLKANVKRDDVVVTHHLPSFGSVHPKFYGSPLNGYFCGGAADILTGNAPAAWIHGHTHESVNYSNGTIVVCNPYGYLGHEVNPNFDPSLVVEVN
jgi:predicted phosphodiesterase